MKGNDLEVQMDQELLRARLSALADRSRFHILQIMANGAIGSCCDRIAAYENGCCVADVVAETGLAQPTVSHHLKALEKVNLVRREVRGPWTCYFPNPEAIEEISHGLRGSLILKRKDQNEHGNRDTVLSDSFFDEEKRCAELKNGCCT
ncbi:ArsR/SmtB family transcription factor [Ferroacidibacillus organovorans]|uniref:HTH arsR-type domain-containing protein n=1 Tax=Ferroacidibacillus organovorans TaxID=1765683 RepID=A0A1V4ETV1_9BACL|nr:metalloregulator ArsR/SmtB family transcription factor [Ferroacidibacillus organovorans]OPG16367.1 hypothetical protein B2M26_05650 [Ferroacidibacillus organovorans]